MKTYLFILFFCIAIPSQAQRYMTRNGYIKFYSQAPIEDIKAENEQVAAILNGEDGSLSFALLIKSFEFKKALMQEHFNENYLESDEFPKAIFKGKILEFNKDMVKKTGEHKVIVSGKLTIHGQTRDVKIPATLNVSKEGIKGSAKFIITPEEYHIRIPNAVRNNIAKEIEVTVLVDLKS